MSEWTYSMPLDPEKLNGVGIETGYHFGATTAVRELTDRIAELEADLNSDYHNKEHVRQSFTIVAQAEYIKKLEAQGAAYEERIGMLKTQVETLTPKPKVVSEWVNFYRHGLGDWASTLEDSLKGADGAKSFIARLRKDKIKHPDGRVEYKLEVEP